MGSVVFGDFPHQQRLKRWLERWRFITDPFIGSQADQEGEVLPLFFVDRPYVREILGDPSFPQTAFLLAGQRPGQNRHREMVAYFAARREAQHLALPINYLDFGPVLEAAGGDPRRVTMRDHSAVILRLWLAALVRHVPGIYYDKLSELDGSLLLGAGQAFADPITQARLSGLIKQESRLKIAWHDLSPVELLQTMVEVMRKLGERDPLYQSVYILVDRVDESSAGLAGAAALLRSLVAEGPLLEMPHVAFKFFLPHEVMTQLRSMVPLREDRMCIRTITWDESALEDVIAERVQYFSENRVQSFDEICTADNRGTALKRLIKAADDSPRRLIKLCKLTVEAHVRQSPDYDLHLRRQDIADALIEFQREQEAGQNPAKGPATIEERYPASRPSSGLYLEAGHVWIDGQPLSNTLSELEFKLLDALYRQSPQIVPNEDLIQRVWGTDNIMDTTSLRKLVDRLRAGLEPQREGRGRFIQNARGTRLLAQARVGRCPPPRLSHACHLLAIRLGYNAPLSHGILWLSKALSFSCIRASLE